jgi:hypothetical protein
VALIAASLFNCGCASIEFTPKPSIEPSAPWTIKAENAKPGSTDWHLTDAAEEGEIEGYASSTSVNRGESISIYVSTDDPTYMLQVFRMGWYGGKGAREMMPPVVRTGITQPIPTPDPQTHLVECHWQNPYILQIQTSSDPTQWASGIYLVKLTGLASGKQSFVIFVVRDDARSSDLLFQLGLNTDEAYNAWGGWSLYTQPRAYKVSFDRPYKPGYGQGYFLEWPYNMVRFLEREGYDVTYSTDVDTDLRGELLLQHKAFLSVGHDEYWSWRMRDNVEHARNRGVSLGFFGADTSNWQIRFEPSAATGVPDRTIVCYKDASLDPVEKDSNLRHLTTTLFRDPPVARAEDEMAGVSYEGWLRGPSQDMVVTDASSWIFRNTGAVNGTHLTGLLGYELDRMHKYYPAGTRSVAHSPWIAFDGAAHYADMTYYTTIAGSTVVSTGSMDWNLGLDDFDWDHPKLTSSVAQQATRNILKKFGATDPRNIQVP